MTNSERERKVLDAVPTGLLIGGQWRSSSSKATVKLEDPATGEVLTEVADATPADGMAALAAAHGAQTRFAAVPPRERSDILMRAYRAMIDRADDLALLMRLHAADLRDGRDAEPALTGSHLVA